MALLTPVQLASLCNETYSIYKHLVLLRYRSQTMRNRLTISSQCLGTGNLMKAVLCWDSRGLFEVDKPAVKT